MVVLRPILFILKNVRHDNNINFGPSIYTNKSFLKNMYYVVLLNFWSYLVLRLRICS